MFAYRIQSDESEDEAFLSPLDVQWSERRKINYRLLSFQRRLIIALPKNILCFHQMTKSHLQAAEHSSDYHFPLHNVFVFAHITGFMFVSRSEGGRDQKNFCHSMTFKAMMWAHCQRWWTLCVFSWQGEVKLPQKSLPSTDDWKAEKPRSRSSCSVKCVAAQKRKGAAAKNTKLICFCAP
jgi:hypothetical protein